MKGFISVDSDDLVPLRLSMAGEPGNTWLLYLWPKEAGAPVLVVESGILLDNFS